MSQRKFRFKGNVLKYFDVTVNGLICKICSSILISYRSYNLRVHLKNVHNIVPDEPAANSKAQFDSDHIKLHFKRNTIKVEVCEKELIRSYIGLVTDDSMPFEFLDSGNFAMLINPMCEAINAKSGNNFSLNSAFCKTVLKSIADNFRTNVKSEVYQRLISLKVENASGLSRNLFGISIQFVKNGELKSYGIGIAEMKGIGINASQSLFTDILRVLNNYDISFNQITSISSENNAVIPKTIQTVSSCSHIEEESDDQNLDEGNELYFKNIQLFKDTSIIDLGEIQITRYLAYAAHLCVLDVIQEPEISSFIFSCRNYVKFVKKPLNGFEELFAQQNISMPQLDCATKCGSTYTMIEAIKNTKTIAVKIEPIENQLVDENFVINESFWSFIEAFCIVFKPLHLAITKFQEELLHYGSFYAEWLKCQLCTEKIFENSSNVQVNSISNILLERMQIRTEELLSNESFLACLLLDPRFNHTLTPTKKLHAIAYLKKVYEQIKLVTVQIEQIKTEEISIPAATTSSTENVEFSQKADEYLNDYLTRNFVPKSNSTINVALKLENLQLPFSGVDSNVFQFWLDKQSSQPEIYALSNVCFAIPSNQISWEQTFSSLRNIFEDTGNNRDILETIMIVKQNPSLLDDAVNNLDVCKNED